MDKYLQIFIFFSDLFTKREDVVRLVRERIKSNEDKIADQDRANKLARQHYKETLERYG